jgi:hypothetical protein
MEHSTMRTLLRRKRHAADGRSSNTADVESCGCTDIEKGEGTSLDQEVRYEEARSPRRHVAIRSNLLPALILLVGAGACALILGV